LQPEPAKGRLLIIDRFTNRTDRAIAIRCRHELRLVDGRCERVNFGGCESPGVEVLTRPQSPYIFLSRHDGGIGLAAYDDVLRQQAAFSYDDERQAADMRDDWFGLPAKGGYTMTWAVYCTASGNVFDLINLLRRDWDVSFPIAGGVNFFDPDAILQYDDAKLKEHLERLNINITMSQGGWMDWKLWRAGTHNIGHGPIVAANIYADYRRRLRQAVEKLHRLRPGIKCLIYYCHSEIAGPGILKQYPDSLWRLPGNTPRQYVEKSDWGFPLANAVPTLDNTLGKEILAKIPTMILDEIKADGLYWDMMATDHANQPDLSHPDGYTYVTDSRTGRIQQAGGLPDLAGLAFRLALIQAFHNRGAMIVGNCPPSTMTEQKQRLTRFVETDHPNHLPSTMTTCLYTPVSYAGYATYTQPAVAEQAFLADIKRKIWEGNLYLFSAVQFYRLFTRENLATHQYPITVEELDQGVIVGKERIITLRPGRFGWPGTKWSGDLVLFDPEQRIVERKKVQPEADGCVAIDLRPECAAVVVCDR
jgi:hypothetical protein